MKNDIHIDNYFIPKEHIFEDGRFIIEKTGTYRVNLIIRDTGEIRQFPSGFCEGQVWKEFDYRLLYLYGLRQTINAAIKLINEHEHEARESLSREE